MTTGGIQGIGPDPNQVAKLFAEKANIPIDEAKAAIKEEFGNPIQDAAGSVFDFNMPAEGSNNIDLSSLLDTSSFEQNQSEQNGAGNFLQEIMNFFKGNKGPQNQGDPQNQEQGFGIGSGPQKPGDPQPHLAQMGGAMGVQQQPQQQNNINTAEEIAAEGQNPFLEEEF